MKRKSKTFEIKLPIDTVNLEIIRNFVANIALNMGFSEENVHRIELAVDEASTNVIKHAYKKANRDQKLIAVRVTTYPDRLQIEVVDTGKGFNPEKVKTPSMDLYLKKMKRGGLGLYLIKTLMDKVEYEIKPGVRNKVRMIKYLNSHAA